MDVPEYNTYRTTPDFKAWELVKVNAAPAGGPDGSMECENCGKIYEFVEDIPDVEDSDEEV
jgi:hypothetical protein